MSFILYTGEMIQGLRNAGHTDLAQSFEDSYLELNKSVAEALATKLGIVSHPDERMDEGRFAAWVEPGHEGQELPEAIKDFDDENEWSETQ